jgi:predicted ATPase
MIQKLSIRNFKSVRELDLSCRRVNVFIGEPNTGKTNILEAMSLGCGTAVSRAKQVTRTDSPGELFFNNNPSEAVSVGLDHLEITLYPYGEHWELGLYEGDEDPIATALLNSSHEIYRGTALTQKPWAWLTKYYLFSTEAKPSTSATGILEPPFGQNLATLLLGNKEVRQMVAQFLLRSGLKIRVDSGSKTLAVAREIDDTFVSFPFLSCSETLRRMVFHHLAIETNERSVLVFDEPEAHAYPPYTKILAEKIALDDRGNQFFLTTHSPYMLDSLISKTPAEDLNIILCRMENFETKAYVMTEEQKVQIMEWSMDAFFNFDRLLPEME